ncbi:MAG TPA: BatD family protein, partial [Gemmatimonadales bacterium]
MIAALLVLLVQGPRPDLAATVDRARVAAGDVVTLQVRVRTRSAEPLAITLPPLTGFSLVASHEITEVSLSGTGGPIRITTRNLTLRADRPGTLVIGAISAVQGHASARSAPISVTVDSAAAGTAALGGVARGLLDAAPPPRSTEDVTLTLVATADTLLAGQQLDVLAAAWFPRELGNQLRHPPVLVLPTPVGVWGYPPDGPPGVATSRLVRGHWMDLYVAHQTIFPLAPGRLTLAPASLSYAVPVSASILNREERYTLASDSLAVAVLPLPAAGRPADDQGVVAQDVRVTVGVDSSPARVGEPMEVTADVAGTGNVALWPEPALRWPAGFRAYPGETETRVASAGGRVAGTKRFTYLVVPDSAGSFVLPEARFPYYDPVAGAYAEARGASRAILVAPGLAPQAVRGVLALEGEGNEPLTSLLAHGLAPWGWLAILLLPPLAVVARRRRERPRPAPRGGAAEPALTRLGRVERDFLALLTAYVRDAHARDGDGLASALRAAGLESAVADHVVRLRDRLRSARYGPEGVGDQAELAAEVTQVLRALGAEPGAVRRRRVSIGAALLLCLAGSARGQAPGAEVLYGAGALRAAADSFARRATASPQDAAAWYDL